MYNQELVDHIHDTIAFAVKNRIDAGVKFQTRDLAEEIVTQFKMANIADQALVCYINTIIVDLLKTEYKLDVTS
ncbi:MAG: hypothetical protein ACFFD4_08075 [Candidatus Odinarchaeota archaeon]